MVTFTSWSDGNVLTAGSLNSNFLMSSHLVNWCTGTGAITIGSNTAYISLGSWNVNSGKSDILNLTVQETFLNPAATNTSASYLIKFNGVVIIGSETPLKQYLTLGTAQSVGDWNKLTGRFDVLAFSGADYVVNSGLDIEIMAKSSVANTTSTTSWTLWGVGSYTG